MTPFVYCDRLHVYRRVSKHRARQLWQRSTIALCPWRVRCEMATAVVFSPVLIEQSERLGNMADFDDVVKRYSAAYCHHRDTGFYPAFYEVSDAQTPLPGMEDIMSDHWIVSCSWCHTFGRPKESPFCRTCGHDIADARRRCRCAKCKPLVVIDTEDLV